jgi:hypothetical protein
MDRNEAVVDLSDYRKNRTEKELPQEDHKDKQQLIDDIAYHLLRAIQAVKKLTH